MILAQDWQASVCRQLIILVIWRKLLIGCPYHGKGHSDH